VVQSNRDIGRLFRLLVRRNGLVVVAGIVGRTVEWDNVALKIPSVDKKCMMHSAKVKRCLPVPHSNLYEPFEGRF
jgi:hypothetical protein